jgi:hypothetical protein
LAVRLRASWKAPELDEALAAGSSPSETEELLWRATQLVEPEQRIGLADSLEEAVRAVDGNSRKRGLLDRRNLIRDNRSLLLVLAERLRGVGPHDLRGLAMAELLVHGEDSPLYEARSPLQLKSRLLDVIAALDPNAR